MNDERWVPIADCPRYEVSDRGRVRRGKGLLQPHPNRRGYCRVWLVCGGVKRRPKLHRLVAEAFLRPQPEGTEINHLSGDKSDNRAVNLEWVTRRENVRHAIRAGLRSSWQGELHPKAKLTADEVCEIRGWYARGGVTQRQLGLVYGVSEETVGSVVRRETWKHVREAGEVE